MTTITIILILFIYIISSVFINKLLIRCNVLKFIIVSILYLILTWYYFSFLVFLHRELRNRGIYLEFGHADELLVEILFICVIIAIINIGIAIVSKLKKNHVNNRQ